MTIGFVISLVLNVGYVLVVHHDQRVLLMMFATVLVGMGMLLGPKTGAYGMGVILGAAGAVAVAMILVGFFDWRWIQKS